MRTMIKSVVILSVLVCASTAQAQQLRFANCELIFGEPISEIEAYEELDTDALRLNARGRGDCLSPETGRIPGANYPWYTLSLYMNSQPLPAEAKKRFRSTFERCLKIATLAKLKPASLVFTMRITDPILQVEPDDGFGSPKYSLSLNPGSTVACGLRTNATGLQ